MNEQGMLHTDAFAWYMENDPVLRSTVVAIARLDREPDWMVLRDRIEKLTRLVPRMRMRVQVPWRWLGAPRWTVDNTFDLDYHLRRARVPEKGTWADVMEFARTAAMSDFDRTRPLWEFTLLTGLEGGQAAFVSKLHHSLSDGIGGIQLAALVVDPGPEPLPPATVPEAPEGHRLSDLTLASHVVADELAEVSEGAVRVMRRLPSTALNMVRHPVNGVLDTLATTRSVYRFVAPVGRPTTGIVRSRDSVRQLATIDIPLDQLHNAAQRAGCHLNDAYLAGLTEGVRRYHAKFDEPLPELQVTMPISLRRRDDPTAGNRITLVRFTIRSSIEDARQRMRYISALVSRWRHEPAMAHTQKIAYGLSLLPRSYLGNILKRMEIVASDVPGMPRAVWLAGAQITAYYGFGPTIGSAFNATLMSYAETCNIGVNIDASAIVDPDALIACLREGFDDVLATADD